VSIAGTSSETTQPAAMPTLFGIAVDAVFDRAALFPAGQGP
jgi:hypothetical protein